MYKGFDRDEFLGWYEENYETNPLAISLVNNIIDYAHKWEHVSKDQFCEFVADMLDIDILEVAQFCENGMLTDSTLKQLGRKQVDTVIVMHGCTIGKVIESGAIVTETITINGDDDCWW